MSSIRRWLSRYLIIGWVLTAAGAAGTGPVRLEEDVAVVGETIRLSDLLPSGAAPSLREAAASVELGRAPDPGSVRVLEPSQIARSMAGQPSLARQILFPERIRVRRAGQPLARELVWAAIAGYLRSQELGEADLPAADSLAWPAGITVLRKSPSLQVTGMRLDAVQQRAEFRLRCAAGDGCASFLVEAPAAQRLASGLVDKRLATAPPNRTASAQRARVRKASAPILAEAGKPAMLRFDGRGLRIWMRVLCLERGALGQEIRVRDPENHRVFHAEVTGVAELRAIF